MKAAPHSHTAPSGYTELLADLMERVRASQLRASLSVNRELVALYWDIGRSVVERQRRYKWGDRVIDLLARDLIAAFPQMAGFSRANLYRMRAFYLGYDEAAAIVARAVRQLPSNNAT